MKRLLLVDDDAVLTRAYRDWLSKHGFQVNTVGSGSGALVFLESAKPDLIVLDLMMPGGTGVDVLRFVRGQPRLVETPVIVLANELRNDLGLHAARLGIQKSFRKDQCNPSVLMAAIDEILQPGILPAASPNEPATDTGTPPQALPAEAAETDLYDERAQGGEEESRVGASASLLADGPAICGELGNLFEGLSDERLTGPEREEHLQDLFFKVRFLAE